MSQRQFDHFSYLGELPATTTDVIIPDVVSTFFVFALDRFAFTVNDCVRSDDDELAGVDFNDFELNRSEASTY
jgi:hypothetical protein